MNAERCYSVLMSVYYREKPEFLRESMKSILCQTVPTNDFVLVCDGPLSAELDGVIRQAQEEFSSVLQVIRLEKNGGLGKALNIGLRYCKNELVARMDSDDIAYPDRCEKQLRIFEEYSEISICSGAVEEFSSTIEIVEARRVPPETHEEIFRFAKRRNPFNHPCVMYKKSAVEVVGSYQDFYLLEDYYLWIRMLLRGYKGYNIQEPILHMRAGSEMYKRRSGAKYAKSQRMLFRYMYEQGYITAKEYCWSCIVRSCSSIAPNWLRRGMYARYNRERG